jgi:hypothetical protein
MNIKFLIVLVSCVIMGFLGLYSVYLKAKGILSPFSLAIIGGIFGFLGCFIHIILYPDARKKLEFDPSGFYFLMIVYGLIFAISLFIIIKHLLKA